jgi:hypothetical protein
MKRGDVQSQALLDLDRLISTEEYGQIFQDQGRFVAAVVGFPEKEQQLKKILEEQMIIQGTIQQIERQGHQNKWGAWETVQQLVEQYPQDKTLNRLRSDLAIEVSDFVRALTTARRLEDRRQIGSSLAWYLKAQKTYPASNYARMGVERLVDNILPAENGSSFNSGGFSAIGSGPSPTPLGASEVSFGGPSNSSSSSDSAAQGPTDAPAPPNRSSRYGEE